MCVLCAYAGKDSGGFGCDDVGAFPFDADGADTTSAPQAPDSSVTSEGSASDSIAGSTSTIDTLSIDSYARGFVNSSGDQDWYRVTLVAGQQYTFAQNGFGAGAIQDTFLRLFNSAGTEIASDDDSGPLAGSRLTFTASATGTHYISAGGYGSGAGQYILTMNDGAAPFMPVVSVADAADYLSNTYWEINGSRDRHWGSSTVSFNVAGLEPERATLARLAFQLWSEVCNLSFVETSGAANIMLDDAQSGAFSSSSVSGAGIITASSINVATSWYGGIDTVDSYTLQTFIHEIGHSIGLGHAGGYNGSATYGVDNSYANDTWQMSVMSYMSQSNYGGNSYRFTLTPMIADILAVQEMYGVASTRGGDTVYGFGSTAGSIYDFSTYTSAPALTIYDFGGADTLNASGYSQSQVIDLRAGTFSNIGGLVGNIGIFLTSVIENAVGGSGYDTITGNDAANTLRGNGGNDTIDGGAGTDSAVFSGVRAAYTITALGGTSVRVAGPDGTDTLSNVELLVFSDQTISWQTNQPDLDATTISVGSSTIGTGASTTVSYTVTNFGDVAAAASTVGIYLSSDGALDSFDTLLTTRSAPSLGAGASHNDSFALSLPSAGTYYLFAVADYNNAINTESNEGNNASTPVQISVVGPLGLYGSVGSDTFVGGPMNDVLSGFEGNDTLTGAGGDDILDGGAGDDTAIFSHGLDAYSVRDLGTRIEISGPDGSDTLYRIEHLRFADGTVNVVDGNSLFDTLFYSRTYMDVFRAGVDPFGHYNQFGWREGRNPNELFDAVSYMAANPDARALGMSAIDHYHQIGWRNGRDPGPNFDTSLYLKNNPDVAAAGIDPLEHFLQSGRAEGRTAYAALASSLINGFDIEYYGFHNRDVAVAGVDLFQHYKQFGFAEGRNPNAFFDSAGYLAHYTDVAAAGINPLEHYVQFGWREGRDPSAGFDTYGYLAANPDVAAAGMNPLDHYLKFGMAEGRPIVNDGLWHT